MKSIILATSILAILCQPTFAKDSFTFVTHTKAPLSNFLHEVLIEIYSNLGKEVTLIEVPGSRAIELTNSGKADGDP